MPTWGVGLLPGDFEIAPGHRVSEWRDLSLDPTSSAAPDWDKAIEILDSRIRNRFIEPAQLLIDSENDRARGKFGFAILAIDFLLIETIEGFRTGQIDHRNRSKSLFTGFLTAWPAFSACIPVGKKGPALADRVFCQGRCALHHTGSTDRIVVKRSGPMFTFHDDGRIEINRTRLHHELGKEFLKYTSDLRSQEGVELRGMFKRKMGYICQ